MKWQGIALLIALAVFSTLQGCRKKPEAAETQPARNAYSTEPDWNNPQQSIPLNYQQAQGQRVFYADCVWCHANTTPAGPSNISNLKPTPALANDGATLNSLSDDYLQNIITLGGSAMSKSAMMPPWGMTLKQEDIRAVISFMRAIAQPPYRAPAQPASPYTGRH
jgi:mono/diheme cytochrome c family protein